MIKIYTMPNCPKCKVLKEKLDTEKLKYEECNDIHEMNQKSIMSVPQLEIDGNLLNFLGSITWLNERTRSV